MAIKVSSNDNFDKALKELRKKIEKLEQLESMEVQVGYFGGRIHPSGLSFASLMYIHEVGSLSEGIPSRPVFRKTMQLLTQPSDRKSLTPHMRKVVETIVERGGDPTSALISMGNALKIKIQRNFGRNNRIGLLPNHRITQAIKGRDDPLVDEGDLRDAIEVRIKRGL